MNFSACLYCSVDCLLTYSCRIRSSRTCVHRCSRRLNWGRGGRNSVRIYLFVYTFSPLSICTPGDNIQSPNGKKRKRDPILPSFATWAKNCLLYNWLRVRRVPQLASASFSSDLAIHSAPENELERKCKWILLHRIAWLRAVIDKMSVQGSYL